MDQERGPFAVKKGLAQMLKGGVIIDLVTAEHARIAEDAGAVAVMPLERVPADIRAHGGVAHMSGPRLIEDIMQSVTIPVMAKCRIGHFVGAQILEALGVDYIDESEGSPLLKRPTISTNIRFGSPSFAASGIWGRRCVASARARL